MDLLKTLQTRRSIRKFTDEEIDQDLIDKIIKGALTAPSSKGKRPWELIVVKEKEIKEKLSGCRGMSSAFIEKAPLAIVVAADTTETDVWVEDASIIAVLIQLAAHSLGLGSCWVQVRNRLTQEEKSVDDYVKSIIGLPDPYSVECIIAIGHPAEEKEPYSQEKLPFQKVHENKFNR